MHLLILCEGETEDRVIQGFLKPYWSKRFSSAKVQPYSGNGELKTQFAGDTKTQLVSEPDSSVLCLVDLYNEPFKIYQRGGMSHETAFQKIREYMYTLVDRKFHQRFGAFPVVMEPETWLLADTNVMQYLDQQKNPAPETVEHPTGHLNKIYKAKNKSYGKLIDGVNLLKNRCDAKRVYDDNCPHFKKLVDWLIVAPDIPPELPNRIQEKLMAWEQKRTALQDRFDALYRQIEGDHDPSEESLTICLAAETELRDFAMTIDEVYK